MGEVTEVTCEVRGARFTVRRRTASSHSSWHRTVLLLEAEGEFFDDRIGEDITGDALNFVLSLRGIGGERRREREHEVLALAHVGDSIEADAAESAGDRLSLRVEYRTLQRDVNMRCHQK